MSPSLNALFTWLDAKPAHYWAVAGICYALLLAAAWIADAPARRFLRWLRSPWVFAALLALTLLAFRWPGVMQNVQLLDPDESQMLAGAITLRHDPVFWRSVDGTTAGPLDDYVLMLPKLLGERIDFTTGRLVALGLTWIALVTGWLALRRVLDERLARLGILPALTFFAFSSFWNFVQYTSEILSIALLGVALWLLLEVRRAATTHRPVGPRLLAAGVCLGAIPFAKLQAVPMGAWLGLAGLIFAWRAAPAWKGKLRLAGLLIGGALIVPAFFMAMVLASHLLADFWQMYVLNNLAYAKTHPVPFFTMLGRLFQLGQGGQGFNPFFIPLLSVLAIGTIAACLAPKPLRGPLGLFAGFALVSLYAVVDPGREYMHYLQFLVLPATLLAATVTGAACACGPAVQRTWLRAMLLVLFFLGTLTPQIVWRARQTPDFLGHYQATRERGISETARRILAHARPGDTLTVWGWMPCYYVETGLPQATRDAQTCRQIEPGDQRDYYRERFLRDLERARPAVFVDAVGGDNFGYTNRATQAHETFAPLRDFIAAHYRLVADREGSRVYLRRDRN